VSAKKTPWQSAQGLPVQGLGARLPDSPCGDSIFDVIAGGIDENTAFIPGTALDTDVFMDITQRLQLSVADHDGWKVKRSKAREPSTVKHQPPSYSFSLPQSH